MPVRRCFNERKINTPRVSGPAKSPQGHSEGKLIYLCFGFQDTDTASMHDAVGGGTGTDKMWWEAGPRNGEAIAGLREKVREEMQNRLAALLEGERRVAAL